SLDAVDLPDRPSSSLSNFSDASNDRSMLRKMGMIQTDDDLLPEPEIQIDDFDEEEGGGSGHHVEEVAKTPRGERRMLAVPGSSGSMSSPGAFFAKKSGTLGALEWKMEPELRPFWTTPKKDRFGRLIDPLGSTPDEREEKHAPFGETPAGSRRVRTPLYSESPSNALAQAQAFNDSFGHQEPVTFGAGPPNGFPFQSGTDESPSQPFGGGFSNDNNSNPSAQQVSHTSPVDPFSVLKARWAKLAPSKTAGRDSVTHLKVEAENTFQAIVDAKSMLRETVEELLSETRVESPVRRVEGGRGEVGEIHMVSPPRGVTDVGNEEGVGGVGGRMPARNVAGEEYPVFPASPSLKDWLEMMGSPKDKKAETGTGIASNTPSLRAPPVKGSSLRSSHTLQTQALETTAPRLLLTLPHKIHTTLRKPASTTLNPKPQTLAITFPPISYRSSTRQTLTIENPNTTASVWKLTSVGPAYVETTIATHSTGKRHPVEGSNVF
ncbi:hypothetical protein HK097_005803, partial [Rhizophlyctis rosea]